MPHSKSTCAVALRWHIAVAALLAGITLIALAPSARATNAETINQTLPASVDPLGAYADAPSGENPSISDDGRYVAFISAAENLGEHGPAGVNEAYVKDLDTGAVTLASRADGPGGEAADEPGEAEGVERAILSGDGRYVIFISDAENLIAGLPAPQQPEEHPWHVYRRDLQSGETVLVDRVTGASGAILGEREPRDEAISDDGRYVLFSDETPDLEDPSGVHERTAHAVYVRDMQTDTTTLVSRASGLTGASADRSSGARSISPDGRYVAFESAATNLVSDMEANVVSQIYRRDMQTHATILASKGPPSEGAPTGEPGDEPSEEAILVGTDGCLVAFDSFAGNLQAQTPPTSPQIDLTDLCSNPAVTTIVSRADGDGGPPSEGGEVIPLPLGASADGSQILFEAILQASGSGADAREHLYVRDLATAHTTLLDRAGGVEGEIANAAPEQGAISANGCRVAFATTATNLIEPSAPSSGQPREAYVRQLAPCHPPANEAVSGETPTHEPPGGEQPRPAEPQAGGAQPPANGHGARSLVRIAVERLSRTRLVLRATGATTVTVTIARGRTHGRHRHWKRVHTILLRVRGAGRIEFALPRLAPGRYRVSVHAPDVHAIERTLTVTTRR